MSLNSKWDIHRLASSSCQTFTAVYPRRPFFCRMHSMQTSLEESASLQSEDNSSEDFDPSTDSEDEASSQPLTSKQVFLFIHLIVVFWKSYNCHLVTVLFLTSQAPGIELNKYILNIIWLSYSCYFLLFKNKCSHCFEIMNAFWGITLWTINIFSSSQC